MSPQNTTVAPSLPSSSSTHSSGTESAPAQSRPDILQQTKTPSDKHTFDRHETTQEQLTSEEETKIIDDIQEEHHNKKLEAVKSVEEKQFVERETSCKLENLPQIYSNEVKNNLIDTSDNLSDVFNEPKANAPSREYDSTGEPCSEINSLTEVASGKNSHSKPIEPVTESTETDSDNSSKTERSEVGLTSSTSNQDTAAVVQETNTAYSNTIEGYRDSDKQMSNNENKNNTTGSEKNVSCPKQDDELNKIENIGTSVLSERAVASSSLVQGSLEVEGSDDEVCDIMTAKLKPSSHIEIIPRPFHRSELITDTDAGEGIEEHVCNKHRKESRRKKHIFHYSSNCWANRKTALSSAFRKLFKWRSRNSSARRRDSSVNRSINETGDNNVDVSSNLNSNNIPVSANNSSKSVASANESVNETVDSKAENSAAMSGKLSCSNSPERSRKVSVMNKINSPSTDKVTPSENSLPVRKLSIYMPGSSNDAQLVVNPADLGQASDPKGTKQHKDKSNFLKTLKKKLANEPEESPTNKAEPVKVMSVNSTCRSKHVKLVRSKRLMKEFHDLTKIFDESNNPIFSASLVNESLYEWKIKLYRVDQDSLLYRDMLEFGVPFILLNISFPESYPFHPPFLRILSPKIERGFVMDGGAICMELLTPRGWASAYTVEAVIMQLSATLVKGQARISRKHKREFSKKAAEESFYSLVRTHDKYGWVTPPLADG